MGTEREAWELAEKKALEEGYDQVIFKTKNKKYIVGRTTKFRRLNPRKIIGWVRLTYKDNTLGFRTVAV